MHLSATMNFSIEQYTQETHYFGSPVSSISGSMTTIDAFNLISKSGFSSTLVCDDDGNPLGILSATDIRIWLTQEINREIDICKTTCAVFLDELKHSLNRG